MLGTAVERRAGREGCTPGDPGAASGVAAGVDKPPISSLRLPVDLRVEALREAIQAGMPGVLLDTDDLGGRGVHVRVERAGELALRVAPAEGSGAVLPNGVRPELVLRYALPLRVEVGKRVVGVPTRAQGILRVEICTELAVGADWRVRARTEVTDHDWVDRPELRVGVFELPVGRLTDAVMRRSRDRIAGQVDAQLARLGDLREHLARLFALSRKPVPLPGAPVPTKLTGRLCGVDLGPFRAEGGRLTAELMLLARPLIEVGDVGPIGSIGRGGGAGSEVAVQQAAVDALAPADELRPRGSWLAESPGDSRVHARIVVAYDVLETQLRGALVGASFERLGQRVEVAGVACYGVGERVAVALRLRGAVETDLVALGEPDYTADGQHLVLRDVEIGTGGALDVVLRLFRGAIESRINRELAARSAEGLAEARRQLRRALEQVEPSEGMRLLVDLQAVELESVDADEVGLHLQAAAAFAARLQVDAVPRPPNNGSA